MISAPQKLAFAGIYLLKKLDLPTEDGGVELSSALAEDGSVLAPVLAQLEQQRFVERVGDPPLFELTDAGLEHLEALMEEAEALVPSDAELETDDAIHVHEHRGLRSLRERFLWSWYRGELDDLVGYQRARGLEPVDTSWARFLLSDALYEALDGGTED
jgi:DNA-binding PadR family transcriptional regulator